MVNGTGPQIKLKIPHEEQILLNKCTNKAMAKTKSPTLKAFHQHTAMN